LANPTTNYGFVMPTPTDLVTDLPADFGVFGQAVDTQMKTNADAATQKATLTTKGDIYAATGTSTPARLAVGANDTVLTADSTTATGLKWATAAGGGMTLLSTTTLSGSSTAISGISGAYTNLQINIQNVDTDAATSLRLLINGSTYRSVQYVVNSTTTTLNTTASGIFTGTVNLDASTSANNWVFDIYDYTRTTISHAMAYSGVYLNSSGQTCKLGATASSDANAAITSITIDTNGGANFQGGTVYIYGVK
jgi:hypothetical protein